MATRPRTRAEALAVLGLPATASPADVIRAYRRLAKSSHPDVTGRTDPTAGQEFASLTEAYDVLTGPPAPPERSATAPLHERGPAEAQPTTPPRQPRPQRPGPTGWSGRPPIVAGPVTITPCQPRRRPGHAGDPAGQDS